MAATVRATWAAATACRDTAAAALRCLGKDRGRGKDRDKAGATVRRRRVDAIKGKSKKAKGKRQK